MKLLLVLTSVVAVAYGNYCYDEVDKACREDKEILTMTCTSKYGKIEALAEDLGNFANKHIAHNFQYILLSTHFNNYEKNREGFHKLFKKLSDKAWNDAIDLVKYMAKRGVPAKFEPNPEDALANAQNHTYELYELESLSKALDIQKSLAETAHNIHEKAQGDGEIMSYIENSFVHQLRDSVRELSGHTNDLKQLVDSNEQPSLSVYLFDEYLQKLY